MRRVSLTLTLLFGCGVLLGGCTGNVSDDSGQRPQSSPAVQQTDDTAGDPQATQTPDEQIDALLAGMTLREKIGQLFFVRPDALDPEQSQDQINDANAVGVTALTDAMQQQLEKYPVGGVVLFGKNLTDPQQLLTFTTELHEVEEIPMLIAVDEEGGTVARLANHPGFDEVPDFPDAEKVGEGGTDAAYEMGKTIGGYLAGYGIDLDFAPVADVNTNPDNTVIGARAFSHDPQQAAELVAAAVQGFHDGGMLCCIKHYPGHGDTAEDSHKDLAVTQKSWQELLSCELVTFADGIDAGADLVMAGHIAVPEVTGDDTPASLSPQLIQALREELGFTGVIVTDSLAMEGITKQYTAAQAAVQAVQAGVDILLMPNGLAEAFEALVTAVEDGTISESRIDESAARVLVLKARCGLI